MNALNVSKKKVLIITYYWPPSGGSGVQRWLKFVKYLPSYGWTPFVFTPDNPSFDIKDDSLLKDVPPEAEVIRFPIWEPYALFLSIAKISGGSKSAKPTELVRTGKNSLFQKISTWIRGNFFIPDPRLFWVKPSAKFLRSFLDENQIQTVITTGPPHSLHLIGLKLKQARPSIRWIADFRDPWSEWGLLDSLGVGKLARKKHRRLEQKVLQNADEILTITPFYVRRFEALSNKKVQLLTNGFDEDDFSDIVYSRSDRFTIRHVGIINEKCDPRPLMTAIADVLLQHPQIKSKTVIEFIGEVHPDFKSFVTSNPTLNSVTSFFGNIPHKQLLTMYGTSSLLLLVLTGYKNAEGYMPGKLFEYLATGLPIVATGPEDGDAAILLNQTKAGVMIDGDKHDEMMIKILQQFSQWEMGVQRRNDTAATHYSRKSITGELVKSLR